MPCVRLHCLIVFCVLGTLVAAPVQAQEIYTATAAQGDAVGGRSVQVTFVIERYTTDAEHAAVVAAVQEGTPELHRLLAMSPDIGRIMVADRITALKYIYRRPESPNRVALLANEPLAFLDPGTDRHKATSGFDFTLATIDLSLPGFGAGEISPAVSVEVNSSGLIETREYGALVVRLNDVRKK